MMYDINKVQHEWCFTPNNFQKTSFLHQFNVVPNISNIFKELNKDELIFGALTHPLPSFRTNCYWVLFSEYPLTYPTQLLNSCYLDPERSVSQTIGRFHKIDNVVELIKAKPIWSAERYIRLCKPENDMFHQYISTIIKAVLETNLDITRDALTLAFNTLVDYIDKVRVITKFDIDVFCILLDKFDDTSLLSHINQAIRSKYDNQRMITIHNMYDDLPERFLPYRESNVSTSTKFLVTLMVEYRNLQKYTIRAPQYMEMSAMSQDIPCYINVETNYHRPFEKQIYRLLNDPRMDNDNVGFNISNNMIMKKGLDGYYPLDYNFNESRLNMYPLLAKNNLYYDSSIT